MEQIRETWYTLHLDTTKRTIDERFATLGALLARVQELADEGLQPDPREALDDLDSTRPRGPFGSEAK